MQTEQNGVSENDFLMSDEESELKIVEPREKVSEEPKTNSSSTVNNVSLNIERMKINYNLRSLNVRIAMGVKPRRKK